MGSEKITSHFKGSKSGRRSSTGKGKAKVVARVEDDDENTEEAKYLSILKTFDMTTKYGPALGLTRMERWERAEKLNLDPPADVYKILTEHDEDGKFTECVWERMV
mmetsp:Transcript_8171/g.36177  ORF Transcript_8171/g.36177 Transcript_8171/m.36177 type:complete len:106 (+) Transcript_8171:43-360(+)